MRNALHSPSGTSPGRATRLVILIVLVVGGSIAYRYFYSSPTVSGQSPGDGHADANFNNDPLCQLVKSKQLVCVAELGSVNLLGPGHFVAYPLTANPLPKVSFPDGRHLP